MNPRLAVLAKPDFLIPALLAPAGIAVRLIAIGQESFWEDEILSLSAVLYGVIQHIKAWEGSPPLFFYLLKGWSLVFGQSHAALRAFSAVMGGLCVPALYFCARRWGFGRGPSFGAALMLMLNPMAYWFSQQNRYNALLTLLTVLWISVIPSFLRPGRLRAATISYALLGFACFATHYYFIFSAFGWIVGFLAWWILFSRGRSIFSGFIWSNLILLALMSLLFPLALDQMGHNPVSWLGAPSVRHFLSVYYQMYWVGPWERPGLWRGVVIVGLSATAMAGFIFCLISGSRGMRGGNLAGAPSADSQGVPLRNSLLFALWLFPSIAAYIISVLGHPVFLASRYTLPFLPAFILWVVAGWGAWPRSAARWLPAMGVACSLLVGYPSIRNYWEKTQQFDWFRAIRAVESSWQEGDVMVFSPDWLKSGFDFNGGQSRNVVSSHRPTEALQAGRIWMTVWEYSPEEAERNVLHGIRDAHSSEIIVDDGNQTLRLVQLRGGTADSD